ncbi:hypothetical protein L249_7470 [Ophiocordyceps polyrhachis-furcata BCC 54312]|uniref:Ubiquinone biosynthesis protein n=1 Tax=Ophiocordyceps polyrhachis-furcata BCC 54312 TaxID=1330021 RepID=A0A367LAK5_9HYPO|nr:hypothetical protein L249_7470 [Ophiocordyceps polyrhachis-furcata BCC 54312]
MPPPQIMAPLNLTTTRRLASKLALRLRPRCFHSYEHATPTNPPFSAVEDAILAASYRHVPEHGFSQRTLRLGAHDAGYLDISPAALPEGVFGLIRYHLVTKRLALAERSRHLFTNHQQPLSVDTAVAELTWARLKENVAVISRWQEALAIMAQPTWLPSSLKELALLSDELWFLAGEKAVDSSWYTKRASLSIIYSTTELFMTNDKSTGFAETRQFLDRRLNDAAAAGKAISSVSQWVGFTGNASINVLRSKGLRI